MRSRNRHSWIVLGLLCCLASFSGCSSISGTAADLGLAGAGGVAGYHLSDVKVGGAAAGAALGYVGSRVAQAEVRRSTEEAEKRGYDRAMNQAVKQQYWIMQSRQRERAPDDRDAGLVPIVIPETTINGVIRAAHVEYLRVER